MSRKCARTGLTLGFVGLFLILVLLPLVSPVPVEANGDRKITVPLVKDPGTPFEEPEVLPPATPGSGPAKMNPSPATQPSVTGVRVDPVAVWSIVRHLMLRRFLFSLSQL